MKCEACQGRGAVSTMDGDLCCTECLGTGSANPAQRDEYARCKKCGGAQGYGSAMQGGGLCNCLDVPAQPTSDNDELRSEQLSRCEHRMREANSHGEWCRTCGEVLRGVKQPTIEQPKAKIKRYRVMVIEPLKEVQAYEHPEGAFVLYSDHIGELYEAYLLGCEDECIPEPKTFEQFKSSWGDKMTEESELPIAERQPKRRG